MFDCCRVPGTQGVDWSVSYAAGPNPHGDLGHVIVIRKNRFWKIKAEVGGTVAGMGDLIRCSLSSRDLCGGQALQNAQQAHLSQNFNILISPMTMLISALQPISVYI